MKHMKKLVFLLAFIILFNLCNVLICADDVQAMKTDSEIIKEAEQKFRQDFNMAGIMWKSIDSTHTRKYETYNKTIGGKRKTITECTRVVEVTGRNLNDKDKTIYKRYYFFTDKIKEVATDSQNNKKNNIKSPEYTQTSGNNPYYEDYETNYEQPESPPEKVTITASNVTYKIEKGGAYYINIKFDKPVKVIQAPILKVKIGDSIRRVEYDSQTNDSITYKMLISNIKDIGKEIIIESLKDGEINSNKQNTIVTMDYESKIKNKKLGKVDNFILVKENSRGDINKDLRIDNLDVQEILKCTNKTIGDLNGDGKIDKEDKEALKEAINNNSLKYINFIIPSNQNNLANVHGDINGDKIINYKDAEMLNSKLSSISIEKGDVNGDGKVDKKDVECINKALESENAIYLLYIKAPKDTTADLNNDGIINIDDVVKISELDSNDKKGDINSDGIVNFYDQIALTNILYTGDTSKVTYIKAFKNAVGDVNGDGIIDYADVKMIIEYSTNESININNDASDINKDGKVDVFDAIKLSKALDEYGKTDTYLQGESLELLGKSYFIVPRSGQKGDVNKDGIIDFYDANLIAQYTVNNKIEIDLEQADIDGNGKIDVFDAVKLSKTLKGLDETTTGLLDEQIENANKYSMTAIFGDVDNNGEVNINDLVFLNQYLLDKESITLTEEQLCSADVNMDGKVDLADSAILINYIAELISNIPQQ